MRGPSRLITAHHTVDSAPRHAGPAGNERKRRERESQPTSSCGSEPGDHVPSPRIQPSTPNDGWVRAARPGDKGCGRRQEASLRSTERRTTTGVQGGARGPTDRRRTDLPRGTSGGAAFWCWSTAPTRGVERHRTGRQPRGEAVVASFDDERRLGAGVGAGVSFGSCVARRRDEKSSLRRLEQASSRPSQPSDEDGAREEPRRAAAAATVVCGPRGRWGCRCHPRAACLANSRLHKGARRARTVSGACRYSNARPAPSGSLACAVRL